MWFQSSNPLNPHQSQIEYENFKEEQQQKKEFMESVKQIAENAEKLSSEAKTQSDIAMKTSNKADVKGWITVIVSVIGLLIEIVLNIDEISLFISGLF